MESLTVVVDRYRETSDDGGAAVLTGFGARTRRTKIAWEELGQTEWKSMYMDERVSTGVRHPALAQESGYADRRR